MILIHNKDFKSIVKQTDEKFVGMGFATTPGSIAKLFADIINKNISEFYETLSVNHLQAFVTTATGEYLDAIGKLLNCERSEHEVDANYRRRITHQCLSLAKANETSIRLAALACDGVEDVILKKFSYGPGSFTIVPVTKNGDKESLIKVRQAVADVHSFGEKVTVKNPIDKLMKLTINLTYTTNVNDVNKQEIAMAVRAAVFNYVNNLRVGEQLIVNELTQRIMQVSEKIVNYSCSSFRINNKECLFINQGARWDERFTISRDVNSIIVN